MDFRMWTLQGVFTICRRCEALMWGADVRRWCEALMFFLFDGVEIRRKFNVYKLIYLFLSFRRVLTVIYSFLRNSPASEI